MNEKKNKPLVVLGAVCVVYWFLNFLNNAVLTNNYGWLLWYSSAGLLITGIALISQNIKLLYSVFCALFVAETLWIVDLFYITFSHHPLIGFTGYMLSSSFNTNDLYFTLYHLLIPISLFMAIHQTKKTYKYGWIGAIIFATTLITLTYFLAGPISQVNCVHSINQCHTIFSFLYGIGNPYRIIIALIGLTVFVFIPTNYILLYFKTKKKNKV